MKTYTITVTTPELNAIVVGLQNLASDAKSGELDRWSDFKQALAAGGGPLTDDEMEALSYRIDESPSKRATPLADALAAHADGRRFNAVELKLARELARVFLIRFGNAVNACDLATEGVTQIGDMSISRALSDAAVVLAAVETLYTSTEQGKV